MDPPLEDKSLTLTKEATMTTKLVALVLLLFLTTGTAMAQELATLMTKDLAGVSGKDVVMFTVQFPPGWADPVHRHDGQGFIYVLEGSIVMQVKGGKEVTLTPGQSFYEGPDDIHTVGRNASTTKPAKFLVVLIKGKGAPLLVPVK
jgi:quercetin dioxygenase-like cupin family protein